jgi:hypothetical protein
MGVSINQGKQLITLCLALWICIATVTAFSQNTLSTKEDNDLPLGDYAANLDKFKAGDHLFWPMLPGDTIEHLAATLYPNSPILKQRFILKTLSLSRSLNLNIQINEPFQSPRFVIIPNDKAVRELTHRIKKAEEIKQKPDTLKLSYDLVHPPSSIKPTINPSHITLPNTQIAKVETSKIQPVSIDLSRVKTKVTGVWNSITHKSLLVTKHLNQESLGLINSYRDKSMSQIFNDYRLRNIALISTLIALFIGLWAVNKQHQRKQLKVLSNDKFEGIISVETLPETVAENELFEASELVEKTEPIAQDANVEVVNINTSTENCQDTSDEMLTEISSNLKKQNSEQ